MSLAELAHHVLKNDFRRINPREARIILIESSDVILNHLPRELASSAQEQLQKMGVEIRTHTRVTDIREGLVLLPDPESFANLMTCRHPKQKPTLYITRTERFGRREKSLMEC